MKPAQKQHLIYAFVLVIALSIVLAFGYDYTNKIKEDYTSQITDLNNEISSIKKDLTSKQSQINELLSEITKTNLEIARSNKQYEFQLGELNQQISDLNVQSEGFTEIISDIIDSVVSVITDAGQGSGAIISSNGNVITNFHVIKDASKASVLTYDGKNHPIELVGYSIENDIALLRIVSNETFDYFTFSDSDNLKAGQKIVALGNPAGLSFTATEGIISSPNRYVNNKDFIQTDVTINPGNSGGPLINSQGDIVGIANFKVSGYEGLGFAIPSNRVAETVEKIINE